MTGDTPIGLGESIKSVRRVGSPKLSIDGAGLTERAAVAVQCLADALLAYVPAQFDPSDWQWDPIIDKESEITSDKPKAVTAGRPADVANPFNSVIDESAEPIGQRCVGFDVSVALDESNAAHPSCLAHVVNVALEGVVADAEQQCVHRHVAEDVRLAGQTSRVVILGEVVGPKRSEVGRRLV